ncbi:unnamed protein product [Prorocentrum cordatum]|uniref:Threonine synthase n=1 Tax=Prorocentrum cordatum TaxID=2364126 RepID=A0ABN9PT05_9DINO|nr:unnamed protein product [Polarella glacialis]
MRGKENVECFILFPEGRVSQIQQQQMTSVLDSNVHCIAVQGTFDDCQNIVKGLFGELDFKKAYGLGAVNSINWARIMFQITYYFYTYFRLFPGCDGSISFSVPTGNFGDILAGYYAKRMGLPVKHLVIATNSNDILHRFFQSGTYEKYAVIQTNTPSMDIGISSNFERYLYYLMGEDPAKLAAAMMAFNQTGKLQVDKQELSRARQDFSSGCAQEEVVIETIRAYDDKFNYVLDPHTACGVSACDQLRGSLGWESLEKHEMVVLGTAHPGKFGEAVSQATGRTTVLPPGLARVQNAPTRFEVLPNSQDDVRDAIVSTVSRREGKQRAACQCWSGALRLLLGRAHACSRTEDFMSEGLETRAFGTSPDTLESKLLDRGYLSLKTDSSAPRGMVLQMERPFSYGRGLEERLQLRDDPLHKLVMWRAIRHEFLFPRSKFTRGEDAMSLRPELGLFSFEGYLRARLGKTAVDVVQVDGSTWLLTLAVLAEGWGRVAAAARPPRRSPRGAAAALPRRWGGFGHRPP